LTSRANLGGVGSAGVPHHQHSHFEKPTEPLRLFVQRSP
jgi:hypothetical protein